MKSFAALAFTGVVSATKIQTTFMEYIVKYGKSYATVEEYNFRLEVFALKDYQINHHNANSTQWKMGHNKFSDVTETEMQRMLQARGNMPTLEPTYLEVPTEFTPIDWITAGAVNPIQDQGSCGSCWAFSTICGLEGGHFVASGELLKFAEQQLVDCSTENNGCGGGMSYNGYHYFVTHQPMSEASYPYTARNGVCQYDSSNAYNVNTANPWYVTVAYENVDQMKAALALKPLNVSIEASATSFHQYSSGIFNDPACGDQHNHATNVVGMGIENGVEYWLMRNSWGTDWGEQGYMKMEITATGPGQCGVQMWPIYPLMA